MQAQARDRTPALLRSKTGQPPVLPALQWAAGGTFAQAPAPASLIDFADEALRREGFGAVDAVVLKHEAGDCGLPPLDGGHAFALDLTSARRTLDGGLLLFVSDDASVVGWRAEAGALTIWSGAAPELSELAPGSPDRLTLVGRARAL